MEKVNIANKNAGTKPMKPTQIHALKEIALRGGCWGHITLSSQELGKILGISQQSASKRILELLKAGAITRELGIRKQMLKLTPVGMEMLKREFFEYQRIFELGDKIAIRGTVVTGLGEGQYYLNHKEYNTQFLQKLYFQPYAGTLNLKVTGDALHKVHNLKNLTGILVDGFQKDDRTFGQVKCFLARIRNLDCAVVFPERSHYDDVVEIVSKFHLRRTLGLKDGDELEISICI